VEQRRKAILAAGSPLRTIYGTDHAEEGDHRNYGLNPHYEPSFRQGALKVAAQDQASEGRAVELAGHLFFIATLFQPERAALQGKVHPLITAFVEAAASPSREGLTTGGC
jgi:CTP synthase (UTP-ammonia lyase)